LLTTVNVYHRSRLSIGIVAAVMSMASSVALLGVIQWHTVMLTAAGALGAYWFDDLVDLARDETRYSNLRKVRGLRVAFLTGGLFAVLGFALVVLPQEPARLRYFIFLLCACTAIYCLRRIFTGGNRYAVAGEWIKSFGWSAGCVLVPQLAAGTGTTAQTWMAFGFFALLMLCVIDLWRIDTPRPRGRMGQLVSVCILAGLSVVIGVGFRWFPWYNLALLAAPASNLLFLWMRQRALIRSHAVFIELAVGFNTLCGLFLVGAYQSGLRLDEVGPRSVADTFQLAGLAALAVVVGANLWFRRSRNHDLVSSEATASPTVILGFALLAFQTLQSSFHLQSWLLPWMNTRFFDLNLCRWAGETVMVAAILLLAVSYYQMGSSWRIGIDRQTQGVLVVDGVFGRSRNPIYLAVEMYMLGWFLVNPTLSGLLFAIVTPILVRLQILHEETFLADAFGKKYADYAARTPRYL